MATITNLSIENFLSLQKVDLVLGPLNVLVGPNGSGKTNILKVFQFIGDIARVDLVPAIDEFGGFSNLFFRGSSMRGRTVKIRLVGSITKHATRNAPDEYQISFWQRDLNNLDNPSRGRRLVQRQEEIVFKRVAGRGRRITLKGRSAKLEPSGSAQGRKGPSQLSVQGAATGLATLRRLGEEYEASQVEELAQVFEQLRLFEIDVERIRRPARTSEPHRLRPDAANLAAFLQWLSEEHPDAFDRVCDDVSFVLPGFEGFNFVAVGGADEALRLDIRERHLKGATPLARASFGTIRSIALFAMLHDPNPPRLTCLEEIDHGLHPHALAWIIHER